MLNLNRSITQVDSKVNNNIDMTHIIRNIDLKGIPCPCTGLTKWTKRRPLGNIIDNNVLNNELKRLYKKTIPSLFYIIVYSV